MFSLQDGVKYLALAGILYFLIKAFADNKITNFQIFILVIIMMSVIIFLFRGNKCPNREGFQVTNPPVVPSIYPGPPRREQVLGSPQFPTDYGFINEDIEDFKSIMGIDLKVYEDLIKNEKKAKEKIRAKYTDEMVFTTTNPFNTVPLGTQLYGYTYLPPENWFRAYERPPVCVTDKRCNVCPIAEGGTSDLMQFDTVDNVMGPANINIDFVEKVLNRDQ